MFIENYKNASSLSDGLSLSLGSARSSFPFLSTFGPAWLFPGQLLAAASCLPSAPSSVVLGLSPFSSAWRPWPKSRAGSPASPDPLPLPWFPWHSGPACQRFSPLPPWQTRTPVGTKTAEQSENRLTIFYFHIFIGKRKRNQEYSVGENRNRIFGIWERHNAVGYASITVKNGKLIWKHWPM